MHTYTFFEELKARIMLVKLSTNIDSLTVLLVTCLVHLHVVDGVVVKIEKFITKHVDIKQVIRRYHRRHDVFRNID
jgi:hypothetical protein